MALQEELEKQGNWLFKYRGTLPIFILIIGTFLYARTEMHPETFFLEDTHYEIYFEMGCLFISFIGLFIRIYTVGHTPRNTSGRNVKGQLAESLNTSGIYSTVRHPLYLGNFFMWLGPALLTGHFWFVIAFSFFYWIYYERIMFAEEQFLRSKFGSTYTDWAAQTPAFIPSFKRFGRPTLPFSWKKVIKKEKNGLLAIFLIFLSFNLLGEFIEKDNDYSYFLLTACILTGISYVIIKYLKCNTCILDEEGR